MLNLSVCLFSPSFIMHREKKERKKVISFSLGLILYLFFFLSFVRTRNQLRVTIHEYVIFTNPQRGRNCFFFSKNEKKFVFEESLKADPSKNPLISLIINGSFFSFFSCRPQRKRFQDIFSFSFFRSQDEKERKKKRAFNNVR